MRMKNVARDKQGVNDPEGLPASTTDIMYSMDLNYYKTVMDYIISSMETLQGQLH